MSRKDLNLSLDQSMLQHQAQHKPARDTPVASHVRPGLRKKPAGTAPGNRSNWALMLIAGVAIVNMAFLLAAGIWLSTLQHTIASQTAANATDIAPRLEILLIDTNDRLAALQQQFDELRLSFHDHQQLTASVNARIKQAEAASPVQNMPAEESLPKEMPIAADNWYVSLGTFSSEVDSARVRSQLDSIGQLAQVSRYDDKGKASFELRLAGFKDRESAEVAAGSILEKTNLNGLSVWKDGLSLSH